MRNAPDQRLLVRWMFDGLGYLLLFGGNFAARYVLYAYFWAGLLFAKKPIASALFMITVHLYLLVTALLCWITASGLKRNKRWARPVGLFTSVLLVLGFPWLTIAGGIGLYVLIAARSTASPAANSVSARPTTDFWSSKRASKAQGVVQSIFWGVAFFTPVWFSLYARASHMPLWHPRGWGLWLFLSLCLFVNTALHECGHAVIAWAAGFKLHVVSIGPLTFRRDHSGFRCRLDVTRLFESGGYMGAVPVSDRNLLLYETAVVAGGPAANPLTCLVSLAVFFSLPGTAWQSWWWVAAYNAVFAGAMAVGNLIPVGYCDGSMLFHLVFRTAAGRLLLDNKRVSQMSEEADACHGRAAFDEEIKLKEAMPDRSLAFGPANAVTIAVCQQALGTACSLVGDWPAAEFHYRKCIEREAELANIPSLAGNVWCGLYLTAVRRHDVASAGPAYASAMAIFEKKRASRETAGPSVTLAMMALTYQRSGSFAAALDAIEQALRSIPRGPGGASLRGHLLRSQAMCRLQLGEIDSGLAAARSAADIFRVAGPTARGNLAWEDVADLGHHLWCAGQSALSIELLREGIANLESGGALAVAAQYRIKLAEVLRQLDRSEEAVAEMPAEPEFPPARRAFLAERVELHLVSGQPGRAVADGRELAALWRAHACQPASEIASAEALLAKACLAAGDAANAEALALRAADVLGPWQHPDAASCLITLALAGWHSGGEPNSAQIAEALRLIDSSTLLGPVEKARRKAGESSRLRQPEARASAA